MKTRRYTRTFAQTIEHRKAEFRSKWLKITWSNPKATESFQSFEAIIVEIKVIDLLQIFYNLDQVLTVAKVDSSKQLCLNLMSVYNLETAFQLLAMYSAYNVVSSCQGKMLLIFRQWKFSMFKIRLEEHYLWFV